MSVHHWIVGHDLQQVDSQTVTVAPGQTETGTLGYQTPPVENTQPFPVRVNADGIATSQSITVYGTTDGGGAAASPSDSNSAADGAAGSDSAPTGASATGTATPTVSSTGTNTPLAAGTYLEVTVRIENTSEAPLTEDVSLIVGHSPEQVQSKPVTVPPGESTTVSLGYTTPAVTNDQEFPVRVTVGDQTAEQSVLVHGTGG